MSFLGLTAAKQSLSLSLGEGRKKHLQGAKNPLRRIRPPSYFRRQLKRLAARNTGQLDGEIPPPQLFLRGGGGRGDSNYRPPMVERLLPSVKGFNDHPIILKDMTGKFASPTADWPAHEDSESYRSALYLPAEEGTQHSAEPKDILGLKLRAPGFFGKGVKPQQGHPPPRDSTKRNLNLKTALQSKGESPGNKEKKQKPLPSPPRNLEQERLTPIGTKGSLFHQSTPREAWALLRASFRGVGLFRNPRTRVERRYRTLFDTLAGRCSGREAWLPKLRKHPKDVAIFRAAAKGLRVKALIRVFHLVSKLEACDLDST